jgi:hypothetical protein
MFVGIMLGKDVRYPFHPEKSTNGASQALRAYLDSPRVFGLLGDEQEERA